MLKIKKILMEIGDYAAAIHTAERYRTKESYFTRGTAKLTFEKLFAFIIGNNKNSAQIALIDFFRNTEEEPVAKQTLFEAREKISPDAFKDFNLSLAEKLYKEPDVNKFKNFVLLGVDGSRFQLPQEALAVFGGQKSALCETISTQGRALCVNDVLNRLTIAASLKPTACGERKMFQDLFDEIPKIKRRCFMFDRGFYSKKLCDFLNEKDVEFLIRVKADKCQKDIDKANEPNQIITTNSGLKLRVINIILSTGEVEKLVTNIFDEDFEVSDFAEMYNKRWGVEVSYLMLKERLAIENFSSAKELLILQDFHAAVLTYNLMEIACAEQESKRYKDSIDADSKHFKSANRNIAAHEIRACLISIFTEYNTIDLNFILLKMQRIIYRFTQDIRPGRSFSRVVKFPNKKFPMNKKRNY